MSQTSETVSTPTFRPRTALAVAGLSLITIAVMIIVKAVAYIDSGAASALASLVDSAQDASASIMTFLAVRLSLKPADSEHRSGHGKVEGLAALVQAAFIGGAAAFLLLESVLRFAHPRDLGETRPVLIAMVITIALSLMLILVQRWSLRRAPSLAVEASKEEFTTDIAVNLGVIFVVLLMQYGVSRWIDPMFATIVACWMALTARRVACKGLDMLLDRELGGDVREKITRKVLTHAGVLGMHDLRTTKSGMRIFISFDIEVNGDLLLRDAHEITRQLETALLADFPLAEIMIHVDPFGDTQDARHQVAGVHH